MHNSKVDLEKARDYYERALEIRKEQLDPNHVDVANSLIGLGDVHFQKGDLEKAKNCHERAVEIRKEQ